MRSLIIAVAILLAGSFAPPASAQAPTQITEAGGARLSYTAGEWCSFPITYRYVYTSVFQVFSSDGVRMRSLQHVRSGGWFRNDVTGKRITFRASLTLAQDLTVTNFTSDYLIYRGVIDLYQAEDGGVLAVRRGQFRLNRFGEVTFEVAGASKLINICPFLA